MRRRGRAHAVDHGSTKPSTASQNVRNQLGAVFRKVDVTTRSELAFVCTSSHGDRRSLDELPAWSDFFRSPLHAR